MLHNHYIRFFKITLLTAVLLLEFGCSSMNAKTTQEKPVVGNVPVKMEQRLNKDITNNFSVKPQKNEITKSVVDYGYRQGDSYLTQYQNDDLVKQIILVEQSAAEVNSGKLFLLTKNENSEWQENLQCKAYLGKNGIDKVREGDAKTPTGDFGVLMAFGAKDDPGSLVPYTKLSDTMYLCGDKEYYNQFIDVSKINHTCSNNSEHLIRYIPQYNYALFIDYNKEHVYGKGSAIFLHCVGSYPYTLGCVSVTEENMVKILKAVDKNVRICIYATK